MENSHSPETTPQLDLNWLEPFQWQDPEAWGAAWELTELSRQMLADPKIEAATWLLYNREKARQLHGWREALHTVPSAEHYRNTYLWDSGFFITMYSEDGDLAGRAADYLESALVDVESPQIRLDVTAAITKLRELSEKFIRAAVTESFWVVNKQQDNGFIANLQFAKGRPRWFDIEWWWSVDKTHRASNYSQPPVLALSTIAAYKALKRSDPEAAKDFAEGMFGSLDSFYEFFAEHRRHSPDNAMAGVVNPHETGMDSSIQWDYTKEARLKFLVGDHTPEKLHDVRIIDGAYAVLNQFELAVLGGLDPKKQREVFWALDVSFNGIYFHNLQAMAWLSGELGQREKALRYKELSEEVEQSMLEHTWFTGEELDASGQPKVQQKGFYSLKADGEPIDKITVSNLFALMLPNLREEQLEAVLDMMDDHFDTPYPLPSCSTKDPAFDPHNHEKDRLWRGPTWLNVNWYLVESGLKMQGRRGMLSDELKNRCRAWAVRIGESSNELLGRNHRTQVSAERALGGLVLTRSVKGKWADRYTKHITGAWEHYNSLTGEGQRGRVVNFGWSWLARFIDIKKEKEALQRAP